MWRILVTDDEPDVRAIICATLRGKYEVFEAKDGIDALEMIERAEPDFVIMDVMMPHMDGFAACDAIRKSPKYNQLPVMFLTALGSKEDMRRGYGVGANLYLTKPFDPGRLLRNIDVFFETSPPSRKAKRYTFDQLQQAIKDNKAPVAPGAVEFDEPIPRLSSTSAEVPIEDPALRTTKPIARPTELQQAPPAHGSQKPRILLTDDDPGIVELMRLTVQENFEVTVARDGIECVEKLVRYQPDVLVLDVMLPKMTGYQLLERLRANAAFVHLPILVCSAKGSPRDIQFALRMGASDYLVKPFASDQFFLKLRGFTQAGNFRVRPKNLTIEQIQALEAPKAADQFSADEDVREDRTRQAKPASGPAPAQGGSGDGKKIMAEMVRRNLEATPTPTPQPDPQTAPAQPGRIRRFFGLGGDKK